MKVIVHDNTPEPPPPPEKTYDLLGLTEKQVRLLRALTGKCSDSLGLYVGLLGVDLTTLAREDRVTLLETGLEPSALRVETLMRGSRHD